MRRRFSIAVLVLVAAFVVWRVAAVVPDLPAVATAAHFEALRAEQPKLRAFLARMPKGGDLHTHLSGAVYAERLIAFAVRDGLCLRRADLVFLAPPEGAPADKPCGADGGLVPVAEAIAGWQGQRTYDAIIDAFSLRWFHPTPEVPSGHDQFFGTFTKFNAATGGPGWDSTAARVADMTFDQLKTYDAEHVQYAEFMVTLFEGEDRRRMAAAIGAAGDPAAMRAALEQAGMADLVNRRAGQLRDLVARVEALRDCGVDKVKPGCGVAFRYIAQVNRNGAPAEVFAQTALSTALVRAVPDIVAGINYVGPEDYRIARRDYRAHMDWIRFLADTDVPVALHAGELWLGLVPPDDLDFHIRAAVEVARARRIGHGTAIGFERDATGLLEEMRRRDVTVEIALTSSDVILNVRGRAHPIHTYLAAGVPVTLATDDAGVSRIDLTNEYVRAARDQGLGYARLKEIARSSLAHAFLSAPAKAAELERLARASAAFEREVADALPLRERLAAIVKAMFFLLPAEGAEGSGVTAGAG